MSNSRKRKIENRFLKTQQYVEREYNKVFDEIANKFGTDDDTKNLIRGLMINTIRGATLAEYSKTESQRRKNMSPSGSWKDLLKDRGQRRHIESLTSPLSEIPTKASGKRSQKRKSKSQRRKSQKRKSKSQRRKSQRRKSQRRKSQRRKSQRRIKSKSRRSRQ